MDLGTYPTMFDLPGPSHLVAYLPDTAYGNQPGLVVTGHYENGELHTVHLATAKRENVLESVEMYASAKRFTDITSVVIEGAASCYINLYAVPKKEDLWKTSDGGRVIAQYHPSVSVPSFHRYLIPGAKDDKVYDVLCEVRVNPLPLVDENDILPFATLEPVKYAMMAERYFDLGEVDAGTKYRDLAIQTLMMAEKTEEKKQTVLVNNMLYPNSLGEMSNNYSFL